MTQEDNIRIESGSSYGTAGTGTLEPETVTSDFRALDGDEESLTSSPLRSELEWNTNSASDSGPADYAAETYAPTPSETPAMPPDPTNLKPAIAALAENAKTQAGQIAEQAKSQASALTTQATTAVKAQIGTHKAKAADSIGSVSQAVHQTADNLNQNGQQQIGSVVASVATQIDSVTDYLRNKDIDQIASEVNDYAKANPQVFIGGAFLLGIALARFLKSSQRSSTVSA